MPPVQRQRHNTRPGPYNKQRSTDNQSTEPAHRLACLFCKRYPERHLRINGPCTARWGFDSIRSLNEHLNRDHSLRFGCIECKRRFRHCNKSNIEAAKSQHKCEPRDFTDEDPIWMNADQEERWLNWCKESDVKRQDDVIKKYDSIYKSLFPDAKELLPCPYYDYLQPGHRVTLEHYRRRLAHHANKDPRASLLACRVDRAFGDAERLDSEVGDIGIAVQEICQNDAPGRNYQAVQVEARVESTYQTERQRSIIQLPVRYSSILAGDSHTQLGNEASFEVNPSLAFSSPYSLDFDLPALNERESHQKAVEWSNSRAYDSGFYSVGSSQQVKQGEVPPLTSLSPSNGIPSQDPSTQDSQLKAFSSEQGSYDFGQTSAFAIPRIGANFLISPTSENLAFYSGEAFDLLTVPEISDEGMN